MSKHSMEREPYFFLSSPNVAIAFFAVEVVVRGFSLFVLLNCMFHLCCIISCFQLHFEKKLEEGIG